MAQFARPDQDFISTGWGDEPFDGALWDNLDESSPSDTDFINTGYLGSGFSSGTADLRLSDISAPLIGGNTGTVTLRFRYRNSDRGAPGTGNVTVALKEGATTIASRLKATSTSWQQDDYVLSSAEIASITDWTNLHVTISYTGVSGSTRCEISWIELQTPNQNTAPNAPTLIFPSNAATIFANQLNDFQFSVTDADSGSGDVIKQMALKVTIDGVTRWWHPTGPGSTSSGSWDSSEYYWLNTDFFGVTITVPVGANEFNDFDTSGSGTWSVSVKDAAGVASAYSSTRSFTIAPTASTTITLTGIASTSSVGTVTVQRGDVSAVLTGIPSSSAVGSITVVPGDATVSLLGIGSLSAVGALVVDVSSVVTLTGVGPSDAVGSIVVVPGDINIGLTGIDSISDVGLVDVQHLIDEVFLSGIVSESAVGSITVIPGDAFVSLSGLESVSSVGSLSIEATYDITLAGIGSSSAVGALVVFPGEVVVSLAGIAPESTVGEITVNLGAPPVGLLLLPLPTTWSVVIAELDGYELDEVPATDFNCAFVLNDSGRCGFSLPMVHEKSTRSLIVPGQRNIHIYRNSDLFWGGRLWSVGLNSESDTIELAAGDWFSLFLKRHMDEAETDDLKFQDEEQLDVAWKIIQWMQNVESYGIVRDNPAEDSGQLITVRYPHWERVKVGHALQELADSADGFDFEITPDKRWKTYAPERGQDIGVVFELGKNIETISYVEDAQRVVTEMTALGGGSDRNRCIAVATDLDELANYGLLQDSVDYSDIKSYPRLIKKADAELRKYRRPVWQPTLVAKTEDPAWGEYELGDKPTVVAKRGYMDIDRRFRIIGINAKWNDVNTAESFEVYFDEATVDA